MRSEGLGLEEAEAIDGTREPTRGRRETELFEVAILVIERDGEARS